MLLDEPTVGLDPNQISHIRTLIRNTGQTKTIVISTHIMQEVESICSHIIFMHQGRVVLNDSLEKLKREMGKSNTIKVSAICAEGRVAEAISSLPGIINWFSHKNLEVNHYTIETDGNIKTQTDLFKLFTSCDSTVYEFKKEQSSLEDIFLRVSGKKSGSGSSIQGGLN